MLNISEHEQRQQKLLSFLRDISNSLTDYVDGDFQYILENLEFIYTDGFRHNYADLFPLIVEIADDNNDYKLDILCENLRNIRNKIYQKYKNQSNDNKLNNLQIQLTKLSDHINLEIGRYKHYSSKENKILDLNAQIEILEDKVNRSSQETKLLEKRLKSTLHKANSLQAELIAILSIFAAIVFTFSGSLNLFGSALTGMSNTPFFKSVFFVLLCSFVIFNLIFLMLYIVSKIIGKNIYTRCETDYCTCKNGKPKCNILNRLRKRLPYIFWINILMLLSMLFDVVIWYFIK